MFRIGLEILFIATTTGEKDLHLYMLIFVESQNVLVVLLILV